MRREVPGPVARIHQERRSDVSDGAPRKKPIDYLTVEQRFRLDEACRVFKEAFPSYGVFLVGSVMERPDFRDVDVRAIVPDEVFATLYPTCDPKNPAWDTYWHLSMAALSLYLRQSTGLPIDFQVQQATAANEEFPEPWKRNALGFGHARRTPEYVAAKKVIDGSGERILTDLAREKGLGREGP